MSLALDPSADPFPLERSSDQVEIYLLSPIFSTSCLERQLPVDAWFAEVIKYVQYLIR